MSISLLELRYIKQFYIIVLGLIFLQFGCKNEDSSVLTLEDTICVEENSVTEKNQARKLILGKWEWIKTIYPGWTDPIIETPESKNENRTYEFTEEKMNIYVNGNLTSEHKYVVQLWGEGTTLEEETLVVKFEETGWQSMLKISTSGKYLSLVNSYNDAGGDICLQKQ
jgi:hypothetical protein